MTMAGRLILAMVLAAAGLCLSRPATAHELAPPAAPPAVESPTQREARELEAALAHEEHDEHAPGEAAEAWLGRNRRLVALYHERADRAAEVRAMTHLALAHSDLGDSLQAAKVLE